MSLKMPNLLPRNDNFLRLIEQLAGQASLCARHLKAYVGSSAGSSERSAADAAIVQAREEARALATELTRQLCKSFITPFDREDIQDFSAELYKIPKTIEKVKDRIALHGLTTEKGDFLRQIDLIVQEADLMDDMVKTLVSGKDAKKIQGQAALLYKLEHEGDTILGELLGSLFGNSRDARDLILRKDIYDMLEKVIDRYRDAAGVALQIVLKHT